jgi:hypothetical protein
MLVGALLALGITAPVARAQEAVGDGAKTSLVGVKMSGVARTDSTGHVVFVDSSGRIYTLEQNPAMDANLTLNVLTNAALAVGVADSNAAPLDTHRMRLGMLCIKASPSTGAGNINRFAISMRLQLNGNTDSLSTMCIYPYGQSTMGVSATGADTTDCGHLLAGSTSAPWSGEFVVTYDRNRVGPNGSSALFFYPNGMAIPLANFFGRDVYSPSTTFRIRNLSGPTCAVTLTLVGTPL